MAATILIPYVFGLFWKGGTAKAVIWSGAAALVVAIFWFFLFRGARAWAAVGLAYPAALGGAAGTVIWSLGMRITIGSVHEFIVSQIVALIAFPIISKFTKNSKPADEFLNTIFDIMKRSKTEA
jgi:Na+/proline symporter